MAEYYINNAGSGLTDGSSEANAWSWDTQWATVLAGISSGDTLYFIADTYATKVAKLTFEAGVIYKALTATVKLPFSFVTNAETIDMQGETGGIVTTWDGVGFEHLNGTRGFFTDATTAQTLRFKRATINCQYGTNSVQWYNNGTVASTLEFDSCEVTLNSLDNTNRTLISSNFATLIVRESTLILNNISGGGTSDTSYINSIVKSTRDSGTYSVAGITEITNSHLEGTNGTNSGDPLFADPANGNLELLPNSPALAAGAASAPLAYAAEKGYTGTVWYASPGGTGGGASEGDPDDLAGANASASGGDVVILLDGEHTNSTIVYKTGVLFIAKNYGAVTLSGSGNNVTINNTGSGLALRFKGVNIDWSNSANASIIYLHNQALFTWAFDECSVKLTVGKGDPEGVLRGSPNSITWEFNNSSMYLVHTGATDTLISYAFGGRASNGIFNGKNFSIYLEGQNGALVGAFTNSGTGCSVKDCIIAASTNSSLGTIPGTINETFHTHNITGQDADGDPLFADPANGNFELLPNSPALASGVETITPTHYYDTAATGANNGGAGNDAFQSIADITGIPTGSIVQVIGAASQTDTLAGIDMSKYTLVGDGASSTTLNLAGSATSSNTDWFKFKNLTVELTSNIGDLTHSGGQIIFENCDFNAAAGVVGYFGCFSGSVPGGDFLFQGCTITAENTNTGSGRAFARNTNISYDNCIVDFRMDSSAFSGGRFMNGSNGTFVNSTFYNGGEDIGDAWGTTATNSIIVGASSANGEDSTNWRPSDGDPLMADPANGNYELLPNSPALA